MDGRVRYTKMVIRQSLLSLLKEQTIDKITVADVCRLSEINRATFYRHYDNQYSVLFELEEDLLGQVKPQGETAAELIAAVCRAFAEKREDWQLLLSTRADQGFSGKLYQFFEKRLPRAQGSSREEMRRTFLLHGLSGLLVRWAEGGFQEPAEEMAEHAAGFLYDLMGKNSLI